MVEVGSGSAHTRRHTRPCVPAGLGWGGTVPLSGSGLGVKRFPAGPAQNTSVLLEGFLLSVAQCSPVETEAQDGGTAVTAGGAWPQV